MEGQRVKAQQEEQMAQIMKGKTVTETEFSWDKIYVTDITIIQIQQ